jgi:hypothetical protein
MAFAFYVMHEDKSFINLCMRICKNSFEITIKQLCFFVLFGGGLAGVAWADPPPLSLPSGFPALPGAPAEQAAPLGLPPLPKTTNPAPPATPQPMVNMTPLKPPGLPPLVEDPPSGLPSLETEEVADEKPQAPVGSPIPPLGSAVINDVPAELSDGGGLPPLPGEESAALVPDVEVMAPEGLPGLPVLPMPMEGEGMPEFEGNILDAGAGEEEMPEITVIREEAPLKSWQTKLAPAIIPPNTSFRYKRTVLPETIYSKRYDRRNAHLPRHVAREDYIALLFTSVARNDLEATRALLNAGTDPRAVNAQGETPLMMAQRLGAREVAALLAVRGGLSLD